MSNPATEEEQQRQKEDQDQDQDQEEEPQTPADWTCPPEYSDQPFVDESHSPLADPNKLKEFTVVPPEKYNKDVFLRPYMNIGFVPPPYLVDREVFDSIKPPAVVQTLEDRLKELSPKEMEKLVEFRTLRDQQEWPAEEVTDWMLIRYLMARNWDIPKALKMLEHSMKWRREKKPYEVVCTRCVVNPNAHMMCFVGWDLFHRPVMYMSHRWALERQNLKDNVEHVLETYTHAESQMPEGVTKWIACVDFVTYSHWRDGSPKSGKEVIGMLQDHFPERLAMQVLIDPPTTFWVLWKVLSVFIDPKTKQKAAFWYTQQKPNLSDEFPKLFPPHLSSYLLETFHNNKKK